MTNPFVHALIFSAAIVIPGGLLLYFAWRAYKRRSLMAAAKQNAPTPAEAKDAFMAMYPPQSLRGQSRRKQLDRAKAFRRRNSEN